MRDKIQEADSNNIRDKYDRFIIVLELITYPPVCSVWNFIY